MNKLTNLACLFLFAAFVFTANVDAQTPDITYQGQLEISSAPANGNFDFEFLLFDSVAGGTQIGSTLTRNGVAVANGIFSVNLNFGGVFTGPTRFLEIRVRAEGGSFTTLSPRQPVASTPYSIKSLTADSAANAVNATNAANATTAGTATNFTGSLSGDVTGTQGATTVARLRGRTVATTTPLGGQVLKYNGTTNQWEPDTDIAGTGGGGGTITGVAPGTGLSGGGATGNVTLSIANGGVSTAQLADSGVTDAKINSVSGGKVTGAVANAVNATTAANATNATTAVTATNLSGPLAGDVTGTQSATTVAGLRGRSVANTVPASGQVLKYNGAEWAPDTDNTGAGGGGGTITGVTAGTGLTGGGTTGSVTVGIANGGVNTTQLADNSVTDAKIAGVAGAKVTGTVANATNAATATNALSLGGVAANQYLQTNGNGSALTNLNASSITTGTLSNARLGQVPTANIADNAVTAPKIATGQIVKSVNTLKDDVTLAAGSNISITPAGNTLTIASTAGGVGGSGAANSVPVWNGAASLGNSLITQSGGTVQLPSFVSLAATTSGNNVAFGNPNSETGMTISGAGGRADIRYGNNGMLKLLNGPGGIPPDTNGIAIAATGDVGIGTTTPDSKLDVVTGCCVAVVGTATAVSGETFGGIFRNYSSGTNATGVHGAAYAPSGMTFGVWGQSVSPSGMGVRGNATATIGTTYGVFGQSDSTSGVGVRGFATAASGETYGGYFQTLSSGTNATGVTGRAIAGSGTTYGVWGQSESTSGYGVIGISTPLSGTTYGVYGRSASPAGRGLFGLATATSGVNYGVWGQSDSPAGFDFYAAGAGTNYGAASSKRWKSSIEPIGQPLDKLGRLRGVYFNWDAEHGGRHDVGMIAEEVGAVLPEIVNYEENGTDAIGMDYSKLTPLLVQAVNALRVEKNAQISEQQERIESQQKQLEQQRKQIESLTKIVCAISSKADICRQ